MTSGAKWREQGPGGSLQGDSVDDVYGSEADYGSALYWDERYTRHTEPFEWFYGYSYFKDLVNDAIPRQARVMVAGCGNSTFCEDLADDGYQRVLGTDISRVVIDQQTQLAEEYPEIRYQQCNMLSTFMEADSFDAIIDKGLYDAIACGMNGEKNLSIYIREVLRCENSSSETHERVGAATAVRRRRVHGDQPPAPRESARARREPGPQGQGLHPLERERVRHTQASGLRGGAARPERPELLVLHICVSHGPRAA